MHAIKENWCLPSWCLLTLTHLSHLCHISKACMTTEDLFVT